METEIREQLSHMTFEDLQKLKGKLGTKVYNATIFGAKSAKKFQYKTEFKDKPTEMSSKKPASRFMQAIPLKKYTPRDPRFDNLCGKYDEKAFKNAYSFLSKVKENDLKALKRELNTTDDPKAIKKIKYLIQRIENQLREESKAKQREELKKKEKNEIIQAIERGEKPQFKTKAEKKIINLISQYEELKSSGKLKKHIQRLRKKKAHQERKKFASYDDN